MHIVMLAAENDTLPGGKVGGIGDVMRDIPPALASLGHQVSIIMPSYGVFHELPGCVKQTLIPTDFRGQTTPVEVHCLQTEGTGNIRFWLLEHPQFSICGKGKIYCADPDDAPFESDATKFALFCKAAGQLITSYFDQPVDAVHLHDWHTAFLAILRAYDSSLSALQDIPFIYSIHNLAIQGIRPLAETESSLESWFPQLDYEESTVSDPRWESCVNPMVAAIRLCERVHTVSPSYAREILKPSSVEQESYYGGEGLEDDLADAADQGKLVGILNGCNYANADTDAESVMDQTQAIASGDGIDTWPDLVETMHQRVEGWIGSREVVRSADFLADRRLQIWTERDEPKHIITSIGRLTEQKARLFTRENRHGEVVLDRLLHMLGHRGVFILLGSGDPTYEQFFSERASLHTNFLFLNNYSDALANRLYTQGHLFLMPSSFEPCGISQMLAMREGQPCLVHAVGGLRDTVRHQQTGFTFSGDSFEEQSEQFVATFRDAVTLREQHPVQWQRICNNARSERFLWRDSVEKYVELLYQSPGR